MSANSARVSVLTSENDDLLQKVTDLEHRCKELAVSVVCATKYHRGACVTVIFLEIFAKTSFFVLQSENEGLGARLEEVGEMHDEVENALGKMKEKAETLCDLENKMDRKNKQLHEAESRLADLLEKQDSLQTQVGTFLSCTAACSSAAVFGGCNVPQGLRVLIEKKHTAPTRKSRQCKVWRRKKRLVILSLAPARGKTHTPFGRKESNFFANN